MSLTQGITLTASLDGVSNIKPSTTNISRLMPTLEISKKTIQPTEVKPEGKTETNLMPEGETSQTTQEEIKLTYDTQKKLDKLTELMGDIMEEQINQELIVSYLEQEKDIFEEWATSKGGSVETSDDLNKFIDNVRSGNFHSNENINNKIKKLMDFIPDIIQAMTKEGVAPAIKAGIQGKNPVIDEVKFVIEKIAPKILNRISTFIENRFEGETATKISQYLTGLGAKLETLPTKVLEKLGPADIISSILDVSLGMISSTTGSYREINHEYDDIIGQIPVLGSLFGSVMSVRDLLDNALGFGLTEEEAIKKIRQTMMDNLWKPTMEEYYKSQENLSNITDYLDDLRNTLDLTDYNSAQSLTSLNLDKTDDELLELLTENLNIQYDFDLEDSETYRTGLNKVEEDILKTQKEIENYQKRLLETAGGYGAEGRLREGLQTSLKTRQRTLQQLLNTKAELQINYDNALINEKNENKLYKLSKIIDMYRGKITPDELDKILNPEVDITIEKSFSPIEMNARQQLESIFIVEKQMIELDNYLKQLKQEDEDIKNYLIQMSGSISSGFSLTPEQRAERERRINTKQQRQQEIRTEVEQILTAIPQIEEQMGELQEALQQTIEQATEQGIDLSFLEQSLNFDEYLRKLTDDSRYWEQTFSNFYTLRGGFSPTMGFM